MVFSSTTAPRLAVGYAVKVLVTGRWGVVVESYEADMWTVRLEGDDYVTLYYGGELVW